MISQEIQMIVLLIPFLGAWLWKNHFTSLNLMFLWWRKVAYLYIDSLLYRIIWRIFLYIGCVSTLQIAKDCIHVASSFKKLLFGVGQNVRGTQHPTVVGILYWGLTKLLYQGYWPWVSLSKATIVPVLMELCLDTEEIIGKMWISVLVYLASKFGSLFHKLGSVQNGSCCHQQPGSQNWRASDRQDKWKITSQSNSFCKNPKASFRAEDN